MKIPTQSFSSLNQFQNCPHQYRLQRVDKVMAFHETEQIKWGNVVHKNIENRFLTGEPLIKGVEWLESGIQMIQDTGGEILVEQSVAITENLEPSTFWDKKAWLRGKIDLSIRFPDRTIQKDWKTGTRKVGQKEQLMLFAGFEFVLRPECETVKTGYAWLKEKKIDTEAYTRKDIPMIWNHFIPIMDRLQKSYDNNNWPCRPSGLCNPWCGATVAQCKHKK